MKRGDVVIVSGRSDFGKSRPAIVIQADVYLEAIPSVTVCPLTTFLIEESRLRINIEPSGANGLAHRSQVMIDKIQTYMKDNVSQPIGEIDQLTLDHMNIALRSFLDLQISGLENILEP